MITDTDRLNVLLKYMKITDIDLWECDALLKIKSQKLYVQLSTPDIRQALDYLVIQERDSNARI